MNDIYNAYTKLEREYEQLEIINSILWDYISEKDIEEINQRLEKELNNG
jgi:hypothetical protein